MFTGQARSIIALTAIVCIVLLSSGSVVGSTSVTASIDSVGLLAQPTELAETADENLTTFRTHWQGQRLYVSAEPERAGEVFQIRAYEDGGFGPLLTEFVLDEDAANVIDTSNVPTGSYVILDGDKEPRAPVDGNLTPTADSADAWWEIAEQKLDIKAEEHSFGEPVGITMSSNRGMYHLAISAEELNATDIARILPDALDPVPVDDETVVIPATSTVGTTFDLRDVQPGEYEFHFAVTDTNVTKQLTIVRTEPDEVANLNRDVIQTTRGDVTNIQINLQDTDQVDISVRSTEVDYRASFTAVDRNEDGTVEIRMNTYRAGWVRDESSVFEPADEADAIRNITRESSQLDEGLPAADYEVTVSVGGEETDLATLVLSEATFDALDMRIATDARIADDPDRIVAASAPAESVAVDDALILHVVSDGLTGLLESGADFAPSSAAAAEHATSIEISPRDGSSGDDLDLSRGATVSDSEGGAYFIVEVDETMAGFEPDTPYVATFRIEEGNPLVSEEVTLTKNFTVEERTVRYDEREGDTVSLRPSRGGFGAGDVVVSGNTSVAPGTELVVVLRSNDPLVIQDATVVVSSSRTWETDFDTPVGTDNFTLHVRDGANTIGEDVFAREMQRRTVEDFDDDREGEDDDTDDEPIHPGFIAIGASLLTLWGLIRFRHPIRSHVSQFHHRTSDPDGAIDGEHDGEGDDGAEEGSSLPWQ